MTTARPESALPAGFLHAVIRDRPADSPQVRVAAEWVRSAPGAAGAEDLIAELLTGPYAKEAPGWLIEAAAACDPDTVSRLPGDPFLTSLPVLALDHPSCSEELRVRALRECDDDKLALFGNERVSERLARATAGELGRRCGSPPAVTPETGKDPSPAHRVLRRPRLHDVVFSAALDLLPVWSPRKREEGEDHEQWYAWFSAAGDAWERMWRDVLRSQEDRHRQILEWSVSSRSAEAQIRHQLLSGIPWSVEPDLLVELAEHDLRAFSEALLCAEIAHQVSLGVPADEVEERFRENLPFLGRRRGWLIEAVLRGEDLWLDSALEEPVDTAKACVSDTWRYILETQENPEERRSPHSWRTPPETLAHLRRMFAEAAVHVIPWWEKAPHEQRFGPRGLRWLRVVLTHLPEVTPELRESARPIIRAGEAYLRKQGPSYRSHQMYRDMERLREDLDVLRRLVDPSSVPVASGVRELGSPDRVEVRELADLSADDLRRYLDAHPGHDALVEKALLSLAFERRTTGKSLSGILDRHSAPEAALLRLTRHLRARLGGNPPLRRAWTALVLSLPEVAPEVVRALPLWSAVRCPQGQPAVVSAVTQALGTDEQAWKRFADNPATGSGEHAWLRLDDVLDAAAVGEPWPAPPSRYRAE
ncbi:hypothetical protein [Nocardiopsis sp. FR4]|uniref:hypothetical protein n=1 Tax=Nocardiopsis sp. FR4 TaxID=2605985 RepID=UPI00135A9A78|nr:hypothetical protein [Nocardiopsis sp. FR4]